MKIALSILLFFACLFSKAQTPTATIVGTNYNIDGSLNSTPMWVTNTLLPLVTVIDGTAVGGGIKVPCPNGAYSFAVIPGQYIAYDAPWTWRFNVPTNSGPFRMIDLINGGITNYFYTNGVTSIDSMTGPILIVGTAVSTNLSTQTLTITGGGGAGGGTVISGTNITVVTNVVGTNISYTVNISNPFQVPSLTSVPIYDAPVVSATNETIFGWEQIDGNQTNAGTLTLGGGQVYPVVGTNVTTNGSPPNQTISVGSGGGGGIVNFSPNFDTNASSLVDLATTIKPTNVASVTISNSGTLSQMGQSFFQGPNSGYSANFTNNSSQEQVGFEAQTGGTISQRFSYGGALGWTFGGTIGVFGLSDNQTSQTVLSFVSPADSAEFIGSVTIPTWLDVDGSQTNFGNLVVSSNVTAQSFTSTRQAAQGGGHIGDGSGLTNIPGSSITGGLSVSVISNTPMTNIPSANISNLFNGSDYPALFSASIAPNNAANLTNLNAYALNGTLPGPVYPIPGSIGQFLELTGTSPETVGWGAPGGSGTGIPTLNGAGTNLSLWGTLSNNQTLVTNGFVFQTNYNNTAGGFIETNVYCSTNGVNSNFTAVSTNVSNDQGYYTNTLNGVVVASLSSGGIFYLSDYLLAVSGLSTTPLNATYLTSGTVPYAALPSAVVTNYNVSDVYLGGALTVSNNSSALSTLFIHGRATDGYPLLVFEQGVNVSASWQIVGLPTGFSLWQGNPLSGGTLAFGISPTTENATFTGGVTDAGETVAGATYIGAGVTNGLNGFYGLLTGLTNAAGATIASMIANAGTAMSNTFQNGSSVLSNIVANWTVGSSGALTLNSTLQAPQVIIAPLMKATPSISILTTNFYSPSNIVETFGGTNIVASSSASMVISNAWPLAYGAGTNAHASVYFVLDGISANGTVNYMTTNPCTAMFTNTAAATAGCAFSNAPAYGGFLFPTGFTCTANTTGWAISRTPGASTPTLETYSGTVTYTFY